VLSRKLIKNQPGRRPMTAIAAFALLGSLVLAGGTALAVHDTGKFQLDGNAQTSIQSNPNGLEDWDKVCPTNSPPSRPASDPIHCLGGTTASDSTFIADAFITATDDIFKGGTDDADISGWQWKQAGPSPDKADIEQAFAAQYTVTAAGPYQDHDVLFFGGTRYANNGNTNIGFWFFQQEVSTFGSKAVKDPVTGVISCPVQSGCGFSGLHTVGDVSLGGDTPGDIFILSAFTGGGDQPTIKIFEWVGPGNATQDYLGSNGCFTSACTLQPVPIPFTPGFTDNRCESGGTVTGDPACAIVNSGAKDSPWFFQDKASGAPANVFGDAEFYEGGLDLTGLGFGDVCFQSSLLNTRSSQSGTSVLQDFALGGFGECSSGTVTTPQLGNGDAIPAGGITMPSAASGNTISVRDHAEITLTGVSSAGGTVTFFLCGPNVGATANCESGGVQIGSPIGISATNPATANSASATLTSVGKYCWRAEYSGDASKGVPPSSDPQDGDTTNQSECFSVNPRTPTLATQASCSATPCIINSVLSDTATLTGTARQPGTNGAGPGGTINATDAALDDGSITWRAFSPAGNGCTTVALAATSRTVTGDGTYPTVPPQTAVSLTATAVGTYTFVAKYDSGSVNTNSIGESACPDTTGTETVTVTDTTGVTTAQNWLPNDSATITSTGGSALNGSVVFTLYNNGTCTAGTNNANVLYTEPSQTVTGASPQTRVTHNTLVLVSASATVSWRAVYTSNDANVGGSSSTCETTQLIINN
jgi:hypothetical protein